MGIRCISGPHLGYNGNLLGDRVSKQLCQRAVVEAIMANSAPHPLLHGCEHRSSMCMCACMSHKLTRVHVPDLHLCPLPPLANAPGHRPSARSHLFLTRSTVAASVIFGVSTSTAASIMACSF